VKVPNVTFRVNSSSGSCRDTCGGTDGMRYVIMLRVALRDYANAANNQMTCETVTSVWFSVRGHASAPKQFKRFLIDIKHSQKIV